MPSRSRLEAELRSKNRMDVLVDAVGNRPGYSLCEWRTTTQIGTGFIVSVANGEEFKARRVPGASESSPPRAEE